jgi:hypothetical protein
MEAVMRMLAALAVGLLAACGPEDAAVTSETEVAATTAQAAAAPTDAIDATVEGFFAPYRHELEVGPDDPDWDRPIYTADLRALIGRWKQVFSDEEVAELQDFGWLCECQDWDSAKFRVEVLPHPDPADGKVEVTARFDPGWNETRDMTFALVDEGGQWLIDDIRAGSFGDGLRAALAGAIERAPTS